VFSVITGDARPIGGELTSSPAVRKLTFTGSTEVGKQIMRGAADQIKRVTLELGGKSANIVFADADIEKAAASAPSSVFENAGQDCCARSRILVQRSALDKFMEYLAGIFLAPIVATGCQ
jgi:acyl-CoA reductase-like NAD-dependent aldehyde dehydrogenase